MNDKITMTKDQLYKAIRLSEQKSGENKLSSSNGPKLYKLSNKVIDILTNRIKDEYYAHHMYRAAANWCHDKNYKKASFYYNLKKGNVVYINGLSSQNNKL